MRCQICNARDAEHHDERDNSLICSKCKSVIQETIIESQEVDEVSPSWLQEYYTTNE